MRRPRIQNKRTGPANSTKLVRFAESCLELDQASEYGSSVQAGVVSTPRKRHADHRRDESTGLVVGLVLGQAAE